MLEVDWRDEIGTSINKKAIEDTLSLSLRRLSQVGTVKIELMITDLKHIQKLNQEYRSVDQPTDVLSFNLPQNPENLLGSVAICQEIAQKQANEAGISLDAEVATLANHGLLHLLGFNHT